MNELIFRQAASSTDAAQLNSQAGANLLAGGTTQLDLMKCGVFTPSSLVSILDLPKLDQIEFTDDGIKIGALVKMSQLADHPQCEKLAPAIWGSLTQAASSQIRNMATLGGNLRQRTRCTYFRDPETFSACNKRNPGSGCAAVGGITHNHAILGTSDSCIATYPGDFAVALTAFDADIVLTNAVGDERRVHVDEFFLLPGDTPHLEHKIAADEIITAIDIPASSLNVLAHSTYLKVRDRASYEFAAASAAVGINVVDGVIEDIRIALGGVATKPWRARAVEHALIGQRFDEQLIAQAAQLVVNDAKPQHDNRFKIILAPRVITRAVMAAGEVS